MLSKSKELTAIHLYDTHNSIFALSQLISNYEMSQLVSQAKCDSTNKNCDPERLTKSQQLNIFHV